MHTVLMVAFDFPPRAASSGLQRTLAFVRALAKHPHWKPLVLTSSATAYPETDDNRLKDIPPQAVVYRAPALDSQRHLGIGGRYWSLTAVPDRWPTWYATAVPMGIGIVLRRRPKLIWSTYPITTAHWIAGSLAAIHGLPWVCDCRDPMIEYDALTDRWDPANPRVRRARFAIERLAARRAAWVVFSAPSARAIFVDRYPEFPENRAIVIENGFEEDIFAAVESELAAARPEPGKSLRLVHSGAFYPGTDRDPSTFLEALQMLRARGELPSCGLEVVFRAAGSRDRLVEMIAKYGLQDIVRLEPAVPYRAALAEMLHADGLLVFQGYTTNTAIPAKLYEYLRAQKPIFTMADAKGDTAALLRRLGVGALAPLSPPGEIATALVRFLAETQKGTARTLDRTELQKLSREARSQELITLFTRIAERGPEATRDPAGHS